MTSVFHLDPMPRATGLVSAVPMLRNDAFEPHLAKLAGTGEDRSRRRHRHCKLAIARARTVSITGSVAKPDDEVGALKFRLRSLNVPPKQGGRASGKGTYG